MLTTAIPANGLQLCCSVCSTIGYHSNSRASCLINNITCQHFVTASAEDLISVLYCRLSVCNAVRCGAQGRCRGWKL